MYALRALQYYRRLIDTDVWYNIYFLHVRCIKYIDTGLPSI
jgi:hypothetical protein